MTLEWNQETMTTGLPEIDEQHREWIRRFNQFEDAAANKQESEAIRDAFQSFMSYAETHFTYEEALMEKHNSPSAALNREEHEKFRKKLLEMEEAILPEGGSAEEVIERQADMGQWLLDHIIKVDTEFRSTLVAQSAEDIGIAPDIEKDAQGPYSPEFFSPMAISMVEDAPDVILIVDEGGEIVFVNGECGRLLGYEARELAGQKIEVLIPPRYGNYSKLRESYHKDGTPRTTDGKRPMLSAQHKSGRQVAVDILLSNLSSAPGQGRLVQVVIRDAASYRDAQQKFNAQIHGADRLYVRRVDRAAYAYFEIGQA